MSKTCPICREKIINCHCEYETRRDAEIKEATHAKETQDPKLKACPFVHKVKYGTEVVDDSYGNGFAVKCSDCGATGSYEESREKGIAAWNSRASEQGVLELIRKEAEDLLNEISIAEFKPTHQELRGMIMFWSKLQQIIERLKQP